MVKFNIFLIKIIKRINSCIKIIVWKLLYLNTFSISISSVFYPGTHVIIDKKGIIKIGKKCFFNNGCSINSLGKVYIGDNCIFGENVHIYDHNHKFNDKNKLIREQGYKISNVKIGNNCWIGSNTVILAGVDIGDNVIIAAGSTITKSIESNTLYIEKKERK